jgi:hypothetical protein
MRFAATLICCAFSFTLGALLLPRTIVLRETVEVPTERDVQPEVRAELAALLSPREEVPPVAQPQAEPPPLAAVAPMARLDVPWADLERTLHDSTLVRSPSELHELAAGVEDVWAVLCAEREFDARVREVLREQPTPPAPWSERKYWHDSRWKPWVEQNLLLFVDQLYRFRVPAAVVDRYRNRKLDQL